MTLPAGWAEAALGDLTELVRGVTYNKDDARSVPTRGLVPVARATNIQAGQLDRNALVFVPTDCVALRQYLQAGDIVVATSSGSRTVVGKAAAAGPEHADMSFGAFCGVIRPHDADTGAWIRRLFETKEYRDFVENVAIGTNINNLRSRDLETYPTRLPPLAEQRRIVAKLDALTARLDRARVEAKRVQKGHEPFQRSLLRSAVIGSLTEAWRGSNPNIETAEHLLARVPAPQQGRGGRDATHKVVPGAAGLSLNDPGAPLPIGWAWVSLLRVAKQESGHTPSRSKPTYWDGGVPWIGIRDAGAHHGRAIHQTMQTISDEGLANSSARLLPAGTVCLSRTASVGYVTVMGRTMATSQDFATWTCTEALLPEYLMYALMAEGDDIRRFGMGSTHTTIYFPELRALHVALPPIEEQREIVRRVRSALARADRLEAEAKRALALIDRLETAILAKAFRGELVPQDPNDEPASVLLERIRARRAAEPKLRPRKAPRRNERVDA